MAAAEEFKAVVALPDLSGLLPEASAAEQMAMLPMRFSIGACVGYLDNVAWGVDQGDYFGGATLRMSLAPNLLVEALGLWHHYDSSVYTLDVVPVQLSALMIVRSDGATNVYAIGGIGWYWTQLHYKSATPDSNILEFGLHAGAGVEWRLGRSLSFSADGRYIWITSSTGGYYSGASNLWMLTGAINLGL